MTTEELEALAEQYLLLTTNENPQVRMSLRNDLAHRIPALLDHIDKLTRQRDYAAAMYEWEHRGKPWPLNPVLLAPEDHWEDMP